MTVSETAKSIAKGYLEKHPEDEGDKHFIYMVCQDAAELYETSSSRMSAEAFITNRMHIALITAKQRRAKAAATPKPKAEGSAPKVETDKPKSEVSKSKSETDKSKVEADKPKVEADKPKVAASRPKPSIDKPKVSTSKPAPKVNKQSQQGITAKPKGEESKSVEKSTADKELFDKLSGIAGNLRCPDTRPDTRKQSLSDILKLVEGDTSKPSVARRPNKVVEQTTETDTPKPQVDWNKTITSTVPETEATGVPSNDNISQVDEPDEKKEDTMTITEEEKVITEAESPSEKEETEGTIAEAKPESTEAKPESTEAKPDTKVEGKREKSYIPESVWLEVLKDMQAGLSKSDAVAKYGVKYSSLGYHITQWRRKGLLQDTNPDQITIDSPELKETSENKGTQIVIDESKASEGVTVTELDFVSAHLDVTAFLTALLKEGKVVDSNGSNLRKCSRITYQLPDNSTITVSIASPKFCL